MCTCGMQGSSDTRLGIYHPSSKRCTWHVKVSNRLFVVVTFPSLKKEDRSMPGGESVLLTIHTDTFCGGPDTNHTYDEYSTYLV